MIHFLQPNFKHYITYRLGRLLGQKLAFCLVVIVPIQTANAISERPQRLQAKANYVCGNLKAQNITLIGVCGLCWHGYSLFTGRMVDFNFAQMR